MEDFLSDMLKSTEGMMGKVKTDFENANSKLDGIEVNEDNKEEIAFLRGMYSRTKKAFESNDLKELNVVILEMSKKR